MTTDWIEDAVNVIRQLYADAVQASTVRRSDGWVAFDFPTHKPLTEIIRQAYTAHLEKLDTSGLAERIAEGVFTPDTFKIEQVDWLRTRSLPAIAAELAPVLEENVRGKKQAATLLALCSVQEVENEQLKEALTECQTMLVNIRTIVAEDGKTIMAQKCTDQLSRIDALLKELPR